MSIADATLVPTAKRAWLTPARALGLGLLGLLVLFALLGPLLVTVDPNDQDFAASLASPGADYWLGADHYGRSMFARLSHGARLSFGMALLTAATAAVPGILLGLLPNNGAVLEGKEFGRAPGYMFSVGVDWDITSQIKLAADLRRTDSYYSTDENIPAYRIGAYTVANARLTYKPTDKLEFFTYANNIFDARKPTWKFDDRTAGGIVSSMAPPREIGIGMKASF